MSVKEKVWEVYGEKNPYYAVCSLDGFRVENIDDEVLESFFQSGHDYVERIWTEIESNLVENFKPERTLDFGCGVGRLTIPLAQRSGKIVGVDISERMVVQAKKNCEAYNVSNAEFALSDDRLTRVSGPFDFVHSFIVLQHIDPKIGIGLFRRMVEMLTQGGVGVLHVQYANLVPSRAQRIRNKIYRRVPFVYSLRNIALRQKHEPLIPTHEYDLNSLFQILQANDCHRCSVRFSRHGADGVLFFFQKQRAEFY